MSLNLGVVVCIKCAGIHRNLGVEWSQIRSIELDTHACEDPENISFMQSMGNIKANEIYEHNVPKFYLRPLECDSPCVRENWIRAKYVRKDFIKGEDEKSDSDDDDDDDEDEEESKPTVFKMPERARTGYLLKQNERFVWQKRWFVLHGRFLHYFKDQTDSYPRGSIDTQKMTVTVPAADFEGNKSFEFHVNLENSDRVYILAAENDGEDMFGWIHALRRAALFYYKVVKDDQPAKSAPVEMASFGDMGEVKMEGEVVKQGGKWKSWNKRYMVLTHKGLFYFKTKPEPQDVPVGGFKVELCDTAICKTSKKPNCFSIITEGRMFFVSCPSEKDMHDWTDAIGEVLEEVSPTQNVDFIDLER